MTTAARHMSLWKDGECICGGGPPEVHGLSPTTLEFLGGLLENAPAMAALSNPTVNSYKRLFAPTTASGATWHGIPKPSPF